VGGIRGERSRVKVCRGKEKDCLTNFLIKREKKATGKRVVPKERSEIWGDP